MFASNFRVSVNSLSLPENGKKFFSLYLKVITIQAFQVLSLRWLSQNIKNIFLRGLDSSPGSEPGYGERPVDSAGEVDLNCRF